MSEGGVAPDPVELMVQLIGGLQVSQAVYVAAELGVATLLDEEGPATVAELAAPTGTQPEALGRWCGRWRPSVCSPPRAVGSR